ncbi:MAG: NAD-dependent epimerase/dehydratase family protein [Calditrichaeota bacterium]|nr:MAG: NAD-dependent epimerase/dehydratase family protein [Calditrichota bacterium]
MKILIIGGTGNISTPITKWLQDEHELTLFNHDTSRPDWLNSGVQVITGDRKNYQDFEKKLSSAGRFDCVIDMIAFEPEDAQADVTVFANKTEQFIFCSTVDVYPKDAKRYPVSEEDEIGASATFPYAYKKVQCERTLWAAHDRGDFKLTVIRPSFTYNETWSPGIHSFGGASYHLDRLIKGKPVILHGDGLGIWVATYRDDTARAFVGAVGNKQSYGQAYNVTGDEWMTHNHIWRTIAGVLGAPEPQFICIPTEVLGKIAPREAEWCVENFRYNNIFTNDKAKRDLGYRYTVSFEQGAAKCIRYLTEHKLIEDSAHYPFYDRIVDQWKKCEQILINDHEQAI